jgi:hypothetical protein
MTRRRHLKLTRDGTLFILGVFLILYETLNGKPPRDALLALAVVLLGLPVALRADERRTKGPDHE